LLSLSALIFRQGFALRAACNLSRPPSRLPQAQVNNPALGSQGKSVAWESGFGVVVGPAAAVAVAGAGGAAGGAQTKPIRMDMASAVAARGAHEVSINNVDSDPSLTAQS